MVGGNPPLANIQKEADKVVKDDHRESAEKNSVTNKTASQVLFLDKRAPGRGPFAFWQVNVASKALPFGRTSETLRHPYRT